MGRTLLFLRHNLNCKNRYKINKYFDIKYSIHFKLNDNEPCNILSLKEKTKRVFLVRKSERFARGPNNYLRRDHFLPPT